MINSNEGQINNADIEKDELAGLVSIENAKDFAVAAGIDPDQIHEGEDIDDLSPEKQAELQEITTRVLEIAMTVNGKPGVLARASVSADAAANSTQVN